MVAQDSAISDRHALALAVKDDDLEWRLIRTRIVAMSRDDDMHEIAVLRLIAKVANAIGLDMRNVAARIAVEITNVVDARRLAQGIVLRGQRAREVSYLLGLLVKNRTFCIEHAYGDGLLDVKQGQDEHVLATCGILGSDEGGNGIISLAMRLGNNRPSLRTIRSQKYVDLPIAARYRS